MKWGLIFLTAAFAGTPKLKGLTVLPAHTFPGGVVLIEYPLPEGEEPAKYELTLNGKTKSWEICPTKKRKLCTFAGVEMDDTPAELAISVKREGAEVASVAIPVKKRRYTKIELKVPPKHGDVSPEDQKRIDEERATMKVIYESGEKDYLWQKPFRLPGKGRATSPYGGQRVFNGTLASTHYGVDLRANEKTWVLAANEGKVVYAANLFNSGNFVALDHGGKLFTTYSHLSSISVKVNDRIKPGQQLGKAGATGRVSGPHLHWAVRIDGLYVDPIVFLQVEKKLK